MHGTVVDVDGGRVGVAVIAAPRTSPADEAVPALAVGQA